MIVKPLILAGKLQSEVYLCTMGYVGYGCLATAACYNLSICSLSQQLYGSGGLIKQLSCLLRAIN